MTATPVLRRPDVNQEFTVEWDACNAGIGAVLTQESQEMDSLFDG